MSGEGLAERQSLHLGTHGTSSALCQRLRTEPQPLQDKTEWDDWVSGAQAVGRLREWVIHLLVGD